MTRAAPRNKYHARPTVVDGIRFHSAGEARRWQELKLLHRVGKISKLCRQVPIELYAAGNEEKPIGKIVVDFYYHENGVQVWEDFKGFTTALAKWKLKHAELQTGIEIRLTGKR